MKLLFGLALLWSSITLSRFQCVLENEYFCSSIPNDFPQGLTSLFFVVINLEVINATVFSSPSLNSVTSLTLANSGITRIEPGALHAFQSLTKLSLYKNSLTDVTGAWLLNPGRLKNLTMAQNLITEISPNMLFGFSNLSTLNLANNRIRRIASGSFKDLPKLTSVDLSGNNLTTLTREIFSGLVAPTVKLGGNPWNCSCDLQDFGLYLQELKNASQLEDAESVLCRSPPSLEGVHVWNISDLNCSLDLLPSAFENGFHKVGLPALLACVVFIPVALSLVLIWKTKRDRQVRPSKEATGLTTSELPHGRGASVTEPKPPNKKVRAMEASTFSRPKMPKVRPKSAMAVLLRTEFPQGAYLAGANPQLLIPPRVAPNEHSFLSSEDFCNFMQWWYHHKWKECGGKEVPSSFLAEVQMETTGTKLPSEGENQICGGNQDSGAPKEEEEDDKGHDSLENPEPFLYLSITSAAEEAVHEEPPKGVAMRANGGHLVSHEAKAPLKRSLTWPYEQNLLSRQSNAFSAREPFLMQFLQHTLAPSELVAAEKPAQPNEWSRREHLECGDGNPGVSQEARPDVETASVNARNSDGGLTGQRVCPRKDNLVYDGSIELNTEEVTKQPGLPLQQESEPADARGARTWHSRVQPSIRPVKNKPSPKPESARPGACRENQPRRPLSDHTSPTGSTEGALVENNYSNLLYEVVENRGRWTRERWKQTHRTGALHDRLAKFK